MKKTFVSLKKDSRTREHKVALAKDQCRLDIRMYSFSQRTDCVNAIAAGTCLKQNLQISQKMDNYWTIDKPIASLSTCNLFFFALDGNLVQSCRIYCLHIVFRELAVTIIFDTKNKHTNAQK